MKEANIRPYGPDVSFIAGSVNIEYISEFCCSTIKFELHNNIGMINESIDANIIHLILWAHVIMEENSN